MNVENKMIQRFQIGIRSTCGKERENKINGVLEKERERLSL